MQSHVRMPKYIAEKLFKSLVFVFNFGQVVLYFVEAKKQGRSKSATKTKESL